MQYLSAYLSSLPRGALCNLYCSGLLCCLCIVLVTEVLVTEAVLLWFFGFSGEPEGRGLHYDYRFLESVRISVFVLAR